MKRWEQVLFGFSSLLIFLVLGIKLHELDMPAARFVRSFDINVVNRVGDGLAIAGKGVVLASAFALIGLIGWWFKRERWRELGLRGALALLAVGAVSQLLKHLIGRPRPRFAHADEVTFGPSLELGLDSFPSGHAINSFGAAAVVGYFLPRARIPLFAVAGLIAISRVVRGSHFPTDIYAGALLGLLVGSVIAAGGQRWRDEFLPTLIRIGVPAVIFVFLVFWAALHPALSWSEKLPHLAIGGSLLLLGVWLRAAALREKTQSGRLHSLGGSALALGVATACGPWWVAGLLLIALVPAGLESHRPEPSVSPSTISRHLWRREALAFTLTITGTLILLSVQGLLPIAS